MARKYFCDEYGPAVDKPVNALCYDLTQGGDDVRGKPETWEALKESVWRRTQEYADLVHRQRRGPYGTDKEVDRWLAVNERRDD